MSNHLPPGVTPAVLRNIESVAQLEQQFRQQRSRIDCLIDVISRFAGSVRFVAAHAALIGLWIAANLVLPERLRFDPSLTFLHIGAALEALFLFAFVLMTQNRQGLQAEHWAHVTLQVGLVTEQEMTKVLQILQRVGSHLGLDKVAADTQLAHMVQGTDVGALAEEVAKGRAAGEGLADKLDGMQPLTRPGSPR